jgi:hypothetical protein
MRKGLLTAALLALLIATPAQADSIVFNKDGDLWLAYPDGSQRTLLASDKAAYGDASVADDGTVVATWGGGPGGDAFELRRLDRTGKVLSKIPTAAKNANWGGVYWARVSPDGTKIAYTFSYQHSQDLPGCPLTPQECAEKQTVYGTIVTHADRDTPIGELGFFRHWANATWIDNERLLLTRGGTNNAGVATVGGDATTVRPWTTFDGITLNMGAANRQLSRVAFTAGGFGDVILVGNTSAAAIGTAAPAQCMAFTDPDLSFSGLTWSPDGAALAWDERNGIWMATVPADCDPAKSSISHIIKDGDAYSPYWGPGDIPGKPRPQPTPTPTPTPTPVPMPVPTPQPRPAAAPTIAAGGTLPKLRTLGKQRKLPVAVNCDGSCELSLTASIAKSVATRLKIKRVLATGRAAGAGRITVTLKLARKTAKALARQKKVSITVRAVGKQAAGLPAATQTTLTLKR